MRHSVSAKHKPRALGSKSMQKTFCACHVASIRHAERQMRRRSCNESASLAATAATLRNARERQAAMRRQERGRPLELFDDEHGPLVLRADAVTERANDVEIVGGEQQARVALKLVGCARRYLIGAMRRGPRRKTVNDRSIERRRARARLQRRRSDAVR